MKFPFVSMINEYPNNKTFLKIKKKASRQHNNIPEKLVAIQHRYT